MIAMLLAAQLSAQALSPPANLFPAPRGELIQTLRRPAKACSASSRLQTSLATPTLLFRDQDRRFARPRLLGELPPAEKCLVEDAP